MATLIVTLTQPKYEALVGEQSATVQAALQDPLFHFDPATFRVEIRGEYRDLLSSENRRFFRDKLEPGLRDPETAIETFGTPAYRNLTKTRRDSDPRVRARFAWEARSLKDGYAAALWAMEKHLRRSNPAISARIHELRMEVGREFGLAGRVVSNLLGPVLWWSARREARRLQSGATYEPQTQIERRNWHETPAETPSPEMECAEEAVV